MKITSKRNPQGTFAAISFLRSSKWVIERQLGARLFHDNQRVDIETATLVSIEMPLIPPFCWYYFDFSFDFCASANSCWTANSSKLNWVILRSVMYEPHKSLVDLKHMTHGRFTKCDHNHQLLQSRPNSPRFYPFPLFHHKCMFYLFVCFIHFYCSH